MKKCLYTEIYYFNFPLLLGLTLSLVIYYEEFDDLRIMLLELGNY